MDLKNSRRTDAAGAPLPRTRLSEWLVVGLLFAAMTGWQYWRGLHSFLFGDDFINLNQAGLLTRQQFLSAVCLLNPSVFRPVGIALYGAIHQWFGLDGMAYHAAIFLLHVVNGLQVYRLVLLLSTSRWVALVTCLGYTYQFVNLDTYCWGFGAVFDVLMALWYWRACIWYVEARRVGGWRWAGSVAAFLVALGSKESAVTLPALLVGYEVLWDASWRRRGERLVWCRQLVRRQWPYYLIAVIFFVQHFLLESFTRRAGPYAFTFTLPAWVAGMAWYLRAWAWGWCPAWLFNLLALLTLWWGGYWRDRVLLFGWYYVVVSFAPVIFLTAHRYPYYWYLPQLGLLMVIARLLWRLRGWLATHPPHASMAEQASLPAASTMGRASPPAGRPAWLRYLVSLGLAVLVPAVSVFDPTRPTVYVERWYLAMSDEHRRFIQQLLTVQPTLPAQALVVFRHAPSLLDNSTLTALLRVLYHDQTISALIGALPQPAAPTAERRPALVFEYAEGTLFRQPSPAGPAGSENR